MDMKRNWAEISCVLKAGRRSIILKILNKYFKTSMRWWWVRSLFQFTIFRFMRISAADAINKFRLKCLIIYLHIVYYQLFSFSFYSRNIATYNRNFTMKLLFCVVLLIHNVFQKRYIFKGYFVKRRPKGLRSHA